MTISAARPARSAAGGSNSTLLMALPLVLGVVGFEQLLHTGPGGPPVYQVLHWLSDSLMALPLGFVAVWLGSRLAAVLSRNRDLNVYVLDWDYPVLFAGERESRKRVLTKWPSSRRFHLHYRAQYARSKRIQPRWQSGDRR